MNGEVARTGDLVYLVGMDAQELRARINARTDRGWTGLDVGAGWYGIVDEADRALAAVDPNYRVQQIKEKFGGLRVYIESSVDEDLIDPIIQRAEGQAAVTCEVCGQPGVLRAGGWIRVLCDADEAERQKMRNR